ncbi:uncharacterized protein E6C27_scaffold175G00150 [Cucumis melo var. makuwa]|uniref:Uncharacterized protein n=1 Tax=Cucumis melo var. makuwa TaxID=1194695 RepID=A0A5A7U7S4_CUCMM|nr:uncharacterized protein E6C27_scaffold175G00150 [Cucumis melo var. makuwa]
MMPFSIHFYFHISFVPRPRYQHTNLLLVILFCRTMVYFTERFLSGVQHLVVSFDRNQLKEDGLDCTTLKMKINCTALKMKIDCAALKMKMMIISDTPH